MEIELEQNIYEILIDLELNNEIVTSIYIPQFMKDL